LICVLIAFPAQAGDAVFPAGRITDGILLMDHWLLKADPGGVSGKEHWEDPRLSTEDWTPLYVPCSFDHALDLKVKGKLFGPFAEIKMTDEGLYNGIAWLRKTVTVPVVWKSKAHRYSLHLGRVDDMDVTYFNGQEIGRTDHRTNPNDYYSVSREYEIPADLIRFGEENTVAAMILDNHRAGGLLGPYVALFQREKGVDVTLRHAEKRKQEYIDAVTRGKGFMPWQEKGVSAKEQLFRTAMEARKDEMLRAHVPVSHPVLVTAEDIDRAKLNIRSAAWAKAWFEHFALIADYIVAQPHGYVEAMIPKLTSTNPCGFTCPNCVGEKSCEGTGISSIEWDYRTPDVIRCKHCSQIYPDPKYPETAKLVCPRSGQTFTYYLNDREREHPDDRTGAYVWKWYRYRCHNSFTGIVREKKVSFMMRGARSLALAYRLTDDTRYAQRAVEILTRLAHCYGGWLYHDEGDTFADCDPLYAAWNDRGLKLEWKRHLCTRAFKNDTATTASMLRGYWGAGRIHPNIDKIERIKSVCLAYDLVYDAKGSDGTSLWTAESRAEVERDFIMEWLLGAEPFVGGRGLTCREMARYAASNKAPYVYVAMATVAKCLGLTEWAETSLSGYEFVRDRSFCADGLCCESPGYNSKYLKNIFLITETLHGFQWPRDRKRRTGTVDLYRSDPMLRSMLYAMRDVTRQDGRNLPLGDTRVVSSPPPSFFCVGMKRFPEYFAGTLPTILRCRERGEGPPEYAVFSLSSTDVAADTGLSLPEIIFPNWMTAILRHGEGPMSTTMSLTFSSGGRHRHRDNLALYYAGRGQTILGDLGYIGGTPMNAWIRSTFSHNLVVVDDQEQLFRAVKGREERKPRLEMAAMTPKISVVEAGSKVYEQCREYTRLAALIKGPGAETFVVDIFRVKGGKKHAYRLFSELAASDSEGGALRFEGLNMPAERPLPDFKASVKREHIFGLHDVRGADNPPDSWQAIWREKARRYRLHVLCQADAVEASNGPGQETQEQPGRRVRYLDIINTGEDVESTFVTVHEPSGQQGGMPIRKTERMSLPARAGPDAVAIRIESDWGTYFVFSRFDGEAEIDGVRFRGDFGVLCRNDKSERWLMSLGAETLSENDFGFSGRPSHWQGRVTRNNGTLIQTATKRPKGWPRLPDGCQNHVIVDGGTFRTGFPVAKLGKRSITVKRFPLETVTSFDLPALTWSKTPGESRTGEN